MAKYLLSTVETWRTDTEQEAKDLINLAKTQAGEVTKYGCIYKNQVSKGEIIQEWYRVTITRVLDVEKEPCGEASVEYKIGAF